MDNNSWQEAQSGDLMVAWQERIEKSWNRTKEVLLRVDNPRDLPTMANPSQSETMKKHPIGEGLDAFRASFKSAYKVGSISSLPDVLDQLYHQHCQEDLKNHAINLLSVLQTFQASRFLRSGGRRKNLLSDLLWLNPGIDSNEFDLCRMKPLLRAALADDVNDEDIWQGVYEAVTETTPPPRSIASSAEQTPSRRNTSSFPNSSEYRSSMDIVLREELKPLYVGVPDFFDHFFGGVKDLETASKEFFERCTRGKKPLFKTETGWKGWPRDTNEGEVLGWFAKWGKRLVAFGVKHKSAPTHRRRLLAQPTKEINGSVAKRKMDLCFVNNHEDGKDWRQILVPGEQKSNQGDDTKSATWLDLGRYVREVFAAQDTRRFVLGFTLCGPLMRIWEFDRGGGTASHEFNINKDGLRFVYVILGFLWMNDEQLGFDPTITKEGKLRFITINQEGRTERFVIDGEPIQRARCIAGRGTTCWKAYREEDPQKLFVIKDSWQFQEREEEGQMLNEAKKKKVVNVAQYYHHENVIVHGEADEIQSNIRGGREMMGAKTYQPKQSVLSLNMNTVNTSRKSRSSSPTGAKRSISDDNTTVTLRANKRSRLGSSTKADSSELPDRVHRRVILSSYGKAIYKASSRSALLTALMDCIEGHRSLHEAGFLHRDISINNLMINEDGDNPTSFLIDLDLAIRMDRGSASRAKGRTGTRAFMAIGALMGELHSFMHDLESFFWVLFWICIHYNGPGEPSDVKAPVVKSYDSWNFMGVGELAKMKYATVSDDMFLSAIEEFTEYYKPLGPCVRRLRGVVFQNGRRWKEEDKRWYSQMKEILGKARDAMLVSEAGGNTNA